MNIESQMANKRFKKVPKEYENVALKWIADDLHIVEARDILTGKSKKWGSSMYSRIAMGLRQAYRNGKIKIVKK